MTPNDYAYLVYYWYGEPHPERIPEILATFRDCTWAHRPGRDLPMAGALLGFETLYPDKKETWRSEFPAVYRFAERATQTDKQSPAWNDYYIAQWFITRDDKCLDSLLDRVAEGGEVGFETRLSLENWSERCAPFRVNLERAKAARKECMIIQ